MNKLPLARNADIVVQELGKELLLYDLKTHKAFSLNETSAIVYRACDGKTTYKELEDRHGYTEDLILLALDQLKEEKLVSGVTEVYPPAVNRREVIKRVGLSTAIALPIITGLMSPRAVDAQSGLVETICTAPTGALCNVDSDCDTVDYCQTFGCFCILNCCTGESVPEIPVE